MLSPAHATWITDRSLQVCQCVHIGAYRSSGFPRHPAATTPSAPRCRWTGCPATARSRRSGSPPTGPGCRSPQPPPPAVPRARSMTRVVGSFLLCPFCHHSLPRRPHCTNEQPLLKRRCATATLPYPDTHHSAVLKVERYEKHGRP